MIRIENLHKSFGNNKVLLGINLKIEKGESMCIIGQSGSGKSVLIKHMIGLLKPDEGKIFIDGMEVTGLGEREWMSVRKKFGMLFQGAALFDSLTVGQNVRFGLERYTDYSDTHIDEIVRDSLEKVGLIGIEHLMPHELSGGMKKRVALARAIAYSPEIVLYDEPSTGIDPIRADAINDMIIMLKKEMKITSVVITHDIISAYKVSDRIAMLYQGKIIQTGSPEDIRHSDHPVIQQFIKGEAQGPIENW
ncbi:MAG: ABC transporter ATP-binding protein [Candidatus Aminicenantes bacterium]|nr:ABC transporter ATP-binding protein [Candidatus Aminicenantes bacterium]